MVITLLIAKEGIVLAHAGRGDRPWEEDSSRSLKLSIILSTVRKQRGNCCSSLLDPNSWNGAPHIQGCLPTWVKTLWKWPHRLIQMFVSLVGLNPTITDVVERSLVFPFSPLSPNKNLVYLAGCLRVHRRAANRAWWNISVWTTSSLILFRFCLSRFCLLSQGLTVWPRLA